MNFRKGFFENSDEAVKAALPEYLRPIITFAYHSGWRKSEIWGLTSERVNLDGPVVRLDPGETKNEEARVLYMNDELLEQIKKAYENRLPACPFVFHTEDNPIKGFRKAWVRLASELDCMKPP